MDKEDAERGFFAGDPVVYDDLEHWMDRLPAPLKRLPIILLAIPGSHDTMTYTIDRNNDIGPDLSAFLRSLARKFSIISKSVIFNWSITQDDDVRRQLNGGVRYLDLRVATKPGSKEIHFLHGLYGSAVHKPLRDVADWLRSHAREIVILDFQHFYSFSDVDHQRLVNIIVETFRGRLCPVFSKFDHISLDWLTANGYDVVVIYRNTFARNYTNLWPSGLWPTPWPDTVDAQKLVRFLDDELQTRSSDVGFVTQCLLTPDTSYVLKHICGTLERNLAPACRKAAIPWISRKQPGKGGLNVVIADFVAEGNFLFCKTVIQSNAKLLRRS